MNIHTIWVTDHVAFSTVTHMHDYYQIIYCQKAGGTIEINGKTHEAIPEHVYFVQPMEPHAISRGNNMRIIEMKFLADDKETVDCLRHMPSVSQLADDISLRRLIREIVKEGQCKTLYCNEATNAALSLFLIRVLRVFIKEEGEVLHTLNYDLPHQNSCSTNLSADLQFVKIIKYIETHLSEKITLDDLSSLVHFNKCYLVEWFKRVWGIPPIKYLNWLRLEKAKELLVTTNKSVTDIAVNTGFQSIHYFSRYFKDKENMTPHSYRLHYAEIITDDIQDEEESKTKKNVTIYDVAAHCGVSVASVSRVLAKTKYPVSDEIRHKVLKSARELNYTFNAIGKMLKTQSAHEIGVIVPNIANPCYAMLVQGMQSVSIKNEYHMLLCNSYRNSETEHRNLSMMLEKRVDGILLVSIGGKNDFLEHAKRLNCRLITVEQMMGYNQLHVGYDYEKAGDLATRHLIEYGHRAIAFIGARLDRPSRVQMLLGYRQALRDASIDDNRRFVWLPDTLIEEGSMFEIENGKAAVRHLLKLQNQPTGCICLNDMTALGAMREFEDAGVRVPEDISIVGFDNIPYSALSEPKLTTVNQHAEQMGKRAMEMMIEQIKHPNLPQISIQLEPKLIQRNSVTWAKQNVIQ